MSDIIVNHFRTHVAHKVGGQAKAMVVTASRLHALRYFEALRRYCDQHGIDDLGVLVALSGTLEGDLSESRANGGSPSPKPPRSSTPTTIRFWWWPRSTRQGSTSRSCMPCTSIRPSAGWRRYKPCPG